MLSNIRRVILEDKHKIPYRPAFKLVTGSTNAGLFLIQNIYWWDNSGGKPFYKFNEPCDHALYRPGDSWCEELLFTGDELRSAKERVSTKLNKDNRESIVNPPINSTMLINQMVLYWITPSRQTFYMLNEPLVDAVLNWVYLLEHRALYPIYIKKDFKLTIANREKSVFVSGESLSLETGKFPPTNTDTTTDTNYNTYEFNFAKAQLNSTANANAAKAANRVADNVIIALQKLDANLLDLLAKVSEFSGLLSCEDLQENYSDSDIETVEDLDLIEKDITPYWNHCRYHITEKGKQVLEAKPMAKATHKLGDSDYEVLRFVKLNTGGDAKYVTGLMSHFEQATVDYLLYMDLLGVQYGELDDLYWITPDGIKALEAKPTEKPKAKKGRKAFTLTDQHIEFLQFVESGQVQQDDSASKVLREKGYLILVDRGGVATLELTAKGCNAIGKKWSKPRDLLFDAISELLFEGTESGGLVGKAKSVLLKDFPSATAQDVAAFVEWYKSANPTLSLPGWQKLPKEFAKWVKAGSPIYTDNGVTAKENDFSELHKPAPKWHLE